jgi:hypothetical protein
MRPVNRIPPPFRSRRRRGGYTLIYVSVGLVAFTGICTLAVDWGRVQLAKTELRRTCDAAARYAVNGMSDGTALAKANWIGAQNSVDGRSITFQAADVETGTWDATALRFTPGTAAPNALRVTARRHVPAVFGQIAGPSLTPLTVQAVARFNVVGYGVVGLGSITMKGNASSSYWSAGGQPLTGYGNIGSNGSISLGGNSSIDGSVFYGPGGSVSGASNVTGSVSQLGSTLSFPPADAGSAANNNNNWLVPSWASPGGNNLSLQSNQSLTLPGGVYYAQNVTLSGGSSLTFTGPATIYCYGTLNMSGNTVTAGNQPGNLTIIMCKKPDGRAPGPVTIGGTAALYSTVYAPQSAVTLSGSGDIYGSVLGLTVDMTGTSAIHYDLSLNAQNGTISLVQ